MSLIFNRSSRASKKSRDSSNLQDVRDDSEPSEDTDSGPDKTVIITIDREQIEDKNSHIIFLSGPLMGKMHRLEEGSVVLGRIGEVNIPINDLGISRRHCEIEYRRGSAILRDLGSTNGTFLNGQRVTESELRDGDKIQISSATIFKYAQQDQIENVFHEELYKMATIDALTGAYNKRTFEERMREEFSYCVRNHVPLSLILFDIDHFKKVNDTYGHPTGDYVLARICDLAKTIIRNEDILARYGGEEFALVLKATDAPGAMILAERLRQLVESSHFAFEGKDVKITLSAGVVTLTKENFENWEAMLKAADEHLYKSKNSGRNRVSS